MTPTSRRNAITVIAVAGLALCGYLAVWLSVDRRHIGLSDHTSTYVGATLLRDGHRGDLYDDAVQAPLHAALIAPAQEANLPFVNPPTAAALEVPLSTLDLAASYRLFGLSQLGCLVAAVLIAAMPLRPRLSATAAVVVAAAGLATLPLLLLGQWDGLLALGLAAGHHLIRRDRPAAAGLVLGMTAAIAKPHLFLGVGAFLLAWRRPRLLAGAIGGAVLLGLIDLALVGPDGLRGLLAAASRDASLWSPASLLGWNGLTGSWLGGGTVATIGAAAGELLAIAGCVVAAELVRRTPSRMTLGFATAVGLSLLASPHLLAHDLVLLAPVIVWLLGEAAATPAGWPDKREQTILLGWGVLNLALALDLGNQSPAPPGRLVPVVLAAGGALLLWSLRRSPAAVPA